MECVIVRVLCLVGVVACEKFYHLNLFASRAYKARHNYYGDGYVACSFQDLRHCARQKGGDSLFECFRHGVNGYHGHVNKQYFPQSPSFKIRSKKLGGFARCCFHYKLYGYRTEHQVKSFMDKTFGYNGCVSHDVHYGANPTPCLLRNDAQQGADKVKVGNVFKIENVCRRM